VYNQGRNEGGGKGRNSPGAEPFWSAELLRGRRMTAGAPESPNNVTRTFFNAVHLLPKASGSNMGVSGRQIYILPRAPSNLAAPLCTTHE